MHFGVKFGIALGNEIGTHSYTHPDNTNILSASQIEFEFNQSMNIIGNKLNPTWRNQNVRSAAVPGAPEGLSTASEIIQHLDYLTGGYSSIGAGYPGAFGYLTPNSSQIYLSPNMAFDFTLIEFGVPVWSESAGKYVPQKLTKEEAEQYWEDEYWSLMKHASQPIIHWPWHDYGPTTGATAGLYSESMFTNTIKTAYEDGAEFLTGADVAQRMKTFKDAKVNIGYNNNIMYINVDSQNVGKFALDLQLPEGTIIKSIDNWYAYNDTKVFLDQNGGDYTVHVAVLPQEDDNTHISKLPMRANLLSLNGNGSNLTFTFEGEGTVDVALKNGKNAYNFSGADKVKHGKDDVVHLTFKTYGVHTATITEK